MAMVTKRRSILDILVEAHGKPAPEGHKWALKAVNADFSSSHGFTWPFPGGVAESPAEPQPGGPCPTFVGDGLCVALDAAMAATGGHPFHTVLLVSYDADDVYGQNGHKVRVGSAHVHAVFDVPKLARGEGCADLTGADLSGANLRGAYLRRAHLNAADLSDANLHGATLTGATLNGATLTGAYLNGAYLHCATLTGATLNGAYLRRADLTDANLHGAYLNGANLNGADLTNANLNGADLHGADLTDAYLLGADLHGADLTGAYLTGAIGMER